MVERERERKNRRLWWGVGSMFTVGFSGEGVGDLSICDRYQLPVYSLTRLLAPNLSLSLSLILVQYISHSLPLFFPSYYHHLSTKLSTILSTILSIYLHHSLCHNSTLAIAISHSLPNNNSQYSLPLILTSLPRPSEIPGLYVI